MCSWKALGCTQFFSVKQNIPSPPPSLCERFFVRVYPKSHKEGEKNMLDRYIKINERVIIAGQTSSGIWYIKELPCNDTKELEKQIKECNRICNKYNKKEKTATKPTEEKKPEVKGLE